MQHLEGPEQGTEWPLLESRVSISMLAPLHVRSTLHHCHANCTVLCLFNGGDIMGEFLQIVSLRASLFWGMQETHVGEAECLLGKHDLRWSSRTDGKRLWSHLLPQLRLILLSLLSIQTFNCWYSYGGKWMRLQQACFSLTSVTSFLAGKYGTSLRCLSLVTQSCGDHCGVVGSRQGKKNIWSSKLQILSENTLLMCKRQNSCKRHNVWHHTSHQSYFF